MEIKSYCLKKKIWARRGWSPLFAVQADDGETQWRQTSSLWVKCPRDTWSDEERTEWWAHWTELLASGYHIPVSRLSIPLLCCPLSAPTEHVQLLRLSHSPLPLPRCYNLPPQVFRLNRNLFSLSQFVLQELEDQDVFRSSPFTEQQSHCCGSFSLSLSLGQVSVSFFRLVATLRWWLCAAGGSWGVIGWFLGHGRFLPKTRRQNSEYQSEGLACLPSRTTNSSSSAADCFCV